MATIYNILMDDYLSYTSDTEAPMIFNRWAIISCAGAALGRQYYLPFGDSHIFPNMYVMLIGDPGTRKSTAIKGAKRILAQAGYDKFSADRTSKEKFLIDLEGKTDEDGKLVSGNAVMDDMFGADNETSDPCETFIVSDEFNEFVGAGNIEFLSMLGNLWDWDSPQIPFKQRLKTSRSVSIYQPTISILSGNTHAGFTQAFPPEAIGQGFMSRLLLIYGEASGKKIAFPTKPSDELKNRVVNNIIGMREKVVGEATMTTQARQMLEVIYRTFTDMGDARFKHYSTRRFTHLLKLCLVCTASNLRTEIGAADVLYANTILTYTEHSMPKAMGEYGKAKHTDVLAKIIAILSDAKSPIQQSDIWKQVQSDLDRPDDLIKLLAGLVQADKIQWIDRRGYLIVRKVLRTDAIYVDFSLMREHGKF